ncbi:unnamed protein product, partial [Oppiella nova]
MSSGVSNERMDTTMDSIVNESQSQSLDATAPSGSTQCTGIGMKFNDATVIVSVVILGLI